MMKNLMYSSKLQVVQMGSLRGVLGVRKTDLWYPVTLLDSTLLKVTIKINKHCMEPKTNYYLEFTI